MNSFLLEFCRVMERVVLLQAQVEDLTSTISQLRDENVVLRAQTNTGLGQATDGSTSGHKAFHLMEEAGAETCQLKTGNEHMDSHICKLVSVVEFNCHSRDCVH
jgi:hypothetical protein